MKPSAELILLIITLVRAKRTRESSYRKIDNVLIIVGLITLKRSRVAAARARCLQLRRNYIILNMNENLSLSIWVTVNRYMLKKWQ